MPGNVASKTFTAVKNIIGNAIRNHPGLVLIVVLSLTLSYTNYGSGTFLTGWDTLHPEFNYRIYWARLLDGVWQEHQGLGAVASQAHIAEIPRVLILMFLDIFLKTSQVRYAYAFLMLLLGPVGVYFLTKYTLRTQGKSSNAGASAAGLFYLLNIGTMQHFYVPLEMFLVHYGFVAWLVLYALKYLDGDRSALKVFAVLVFFSSPQAHTSTLFYSFMLLFGVFTFVYALGLRKTTPFRVSFKRLTGLVVALFFVSAYWLLPNMYYVLLHGSEVEESKIHRLFSDEARLQNVKFGTLSDVSRVRGFLYDWGEHVGGGQFGNLLDEWLLHEKQPGVVTLGYVFFGISVLGVVLAFAKKNRYAGSFFCMTTLAMFFMFNANPPTGAIFTFLQDNLPLFKEATRFTFTKFSIVLMLGYAVFFGIAFGYVAQVVKKVIPSKIWTISASLAVGLLTGSLVYYMLPAFKGGLVSPSMRVEIPDRYFEMFDYMDSLEERGRIANLPIHSFWGWVYYNWDQQTNLGYQGAGFLWFGLKQPLLDREFDRWNLTNEQYYREMSYAVYSQNPALVEQVLSKYNVRWVIIDESILAVGADQTLLQYPESINLLENVANLNLARDFGGGLRVYEYSGADIAKIKVLESFVKVRDDNTGDDIDPVYAIYENYMHSDNAPKVFPFSGITQISENIDPNFVISDESSISLVAGATGLSGDTSTTFLQYDLSYTVTRDLLEIRFKEVNGFYPEAVVPVELGSYRGPLTLTIDNNIFELDTLSSGDLGTVLVNASESRLSVYKSSGASTTFNLAQNTLEPCSFYGEKPSYTLVRVDDGFELYAKGTRACVTWDLESAISSLPSNLIKFSYEYEELGTRPNLCLLDNETGLCVESATSDGVAYGVLNKDISNYALRFLVDARNSDTELGVRYTNIQAVLPELLFESGLSAVADAPAQEVVVSSKLTFSKDSRFSGSVAELSNSPRLCSAQRPADDDALDRGDSYLRYRSQSGSVCDSFEFPLLPHKTGYILEIKAKNVEGLPLRICLTNEATKRCDKYFELSSSPDAVSQYYIIPPMAEGSGYTVNISNMTFGGISSVNELEYLALIPFPHDFVKFLKSQDPKNSLPGEQLVVHDEAFDPGWMLMCGPLPCGLEHVRVNNWANGWFAESGEDAPDAVGLHAVFLPQLLEYLGLVMLFGYFILTLKTRTITSDPGDL